MMKGAIFDVDGVLLDSMEEWDRLGETYLAGLGIRAEKGLADTLAAMSMEEGAAWLIRHYRPFQNRGTGGGGDGRGDAGGLRLPDSGKERSGKLPSGAGGGGDSHGNRHLRRPGQCPDGP